jgi:predicted peptidase
MVRKRAATPVTGRIVSRTVTVDGSIHPYAVFVPGARTPAPRPIILFLHGSGERGSDGLLQTTVGLGPAVIRRAVDFPAIVVMPQCPAGSVWAGPTAGGAIDALDATLAEFEGDPTRLYLTGISMGGYGTWELALSNPGRFAALVPICGGVKPIAAVPGLAVRAVAGLPGDIHDNVAAELANTPVWIFHGSADGSVPVAESRAMAAALAKAGGTGTYTEYLGVGHNSWDRAYDEPGLWVWLFAQRRAG